MGPITLPVPPLRGVSLCSMASPPHGGASSPGSSEPRSGAVCWNERLRVFRHGGARLFHAEAGGAWVAAGAPQGGPADGSAAHAFTRAAAKAGKRGVFFGVLESQRARVAGHQTLTLGWEGFWRPADWEETLRRSSSLRAQVRRAHTKGVRVRKLTAAELSGDWGRALDVLGRRWLERREMAPLGFLVALPEALAAQALRCGAEVWVAVAQGSLLGVAVLLPGEPGVAWLLQHLLRLPVAPNGTSESLVDGVFRWLARLPGARDLEVSLGMVPLHGEVSPLLRLVGSWGRGLFNFSGLHGFKEKLRPYRRERVMLAHPPGRFAGARALWDVLRTFAGDRPVAFALATLFRGPRLVVHSLAWLLVPWTFLLAFVAPDAWFPSRGVRLFWVAFDVLLALGFFAWRRRHDDRWLRALCLAVGGDAVLTTIELATHNLCNVSGVPEAVAMFVGVSGPWLAFTLLVRAARRLRRLPPIEVPSVPVQVRSERSATTS